MWHTVRMLKRLKNAKNRKSSKTVARRFPGLERFHRALAKGGPTEHREYMVDLTIDPPNPTKMEIAEITPALRDYMAAIGRRGGQAGGKRRLQTMTRAERVGVAKKAAKARWKRAPR